MSNSGLKPYWFWIENAKRFDKCVDFGSPMSAWTDEMLEQWRMEKQDEQNKEKASDRE